MANYDINVELYEYLPANDIKYGKLSLVCNGKDCNNQLINAIGRVAVERLPTYAFAKDLIEITKISSESQYHDSVPFNHDMMRDRLCNTPIFGIDPAFAVFHEKYWKNVDYKDKNRLKHENEKRIEAYIDAKNSASSNDEDSIKHITTNDMKIFVDGELTELYSKEYPLLIISLKPREAFKCSMIGVLGTGNNHTCWDACTNFCYDQETIPDKTIVTFRAKKQFDEFVLVSRSLEYLKYRTNILKDEIHRKYLESSIKNERFQIEINNEDHTMGEIINYELQSHDDIMKSSIVKPNHLINNIVFDIFVFDKTKMLNAILESFDNLTKKIEKFEKEFNKLVKKTDKSQESNDDKKTKDKSVSNSNDDKKTKDKTVSNSNDIKKTKTKK